MPRGALRAPGTFFLVEQSWTEPVLLALVVLGTLCAARGRTVAAAVLVGLAALAAAAAAARPVIDAPSR